MRPIDADVLEERLMANIGLTNWLYRSLKETPTLDVVPRDFHDKTCEAMAKRHLEELEKYRWIPSADRLQGYWTKIDVATYRCSECGKIQIADDTNELNFCCCCGSRNKVRRKGDRPWED